jgi:hypothetical protein
MGIYRPRHRTFVEKARDDADRTSVVPPRLWTVEEANARLGELRELLPQLKAWATRLGIVHEELQRLASFWGKELESNDNPDVALRHRLDEEWQSLSRRLEQEVLRLREQGIEVKDLEVGLADFYGRLNGEVVFFCWRQGEEDVGFWHPIEGGYRNRRPLPHSRRAAPRPGGGSA